MATWTQAKINDLPDSAFLYIEDGGEKDEDGKTTPRSLRHFPVRDADGAVDLPHLRNALARIPQSDLPQDVKDAARKKAEGLLEQATAADASERRLSETDAPSYREGEEGRRCLDCAMCWSGWGETQAVQGCRLYAFDTTGGFKPWYVCDSFRAPQRLGYGEARVAFAAVGDKAEDGSVWIELVRSGTHHSGSNGGTAASGQKKIAIDAEWIASLARGAEAILADGRYPTGIPVRLDPTHADDSGPACGRIKEVKVDDLGDGVSRLLGRVAWTAEGAETVQSGRYDSVSIEADPPGASQDKRTGKPIKDWTLTGVVVTNHPFVAGMEPLAASERARKERQMPQIRKALRLAENADEAAVLAELATLRAAADKVGGLEEAVRTVTADRDRIEGERKALADREAVRVLDAACVDGRITAGERDRYAKVLAALGEAETHAIFPAGRVKTAAHGDAGGASPADADPVGVRAAELEKQGMTPLAAFRRAASEYVKTAQQGE